MILAVPLTCPGHKTPLDVTQTSEERLCSKVHLNGHSHTADAWQSSHVHGCCDFPSQPGSAHHLCHWTTDNHLCFHQHLVRVASPAPQGPCGCFSPTLPQTFRDSKEDSKSPPQRPQRLRSGQKLEGTGQPIWLKFKSYSSLKQRSATIPPDICSGNSQSRLVA
jgi:hypothetical protein